MNKKLILIAGAALLTIVVIIAALLGSKAASEESLKLSSPFATDLDYAHQSGANKIQYFSGNAFKEYDISSQTSRALTPNLALPNVIDVRWSDQGALFQANNYGPLDQLRPILTAKGVATDNVFWWAIDFKTGAISLVGTPDGSQYEGVSVGDAIWSSDGQFYYYLQTQTFQDQPTKTTLFLGSASGVSKSLGQVSATHLVWTNGDRLAYRNLSDSHHFLGEIDLKTMKSSELQDQFGGPVYINRSGTASLLIKTAIESGYEGFAGLAGPLDYLNHQGRQTTAIAPNFAGTVAWSRSGQAWAAIETNEDGKLGGYISSADGKIKKLTVAHNKSERLPAGLRIVGYENEQLLLLDDTNTAYLVAANLPELKVVTPSDPSRTVYTGINQLLEYGLTSTQLTSLKQILYQYARSIDQPAKEISVEGSKIKKLPRDRESESTIETLNFPVTIDGKNIYTAKLEYFDLKSVQLYLYSGNYAKEVYNSGVITGSN